MISRVGIIARGLSANHTINSVSNFGLRYHHVLSASKWSISCEQNDKNKHNTNARHGIQQLTFPNKFEQHRNFSVTSFRASNAAAAAAIVTEIPNLPTLPVDESVINSLAANGEPTLVSLGLGGNSPIGLLQSALEHLHVAYDIPWWGCIAISTVVIRLLLTPLVIITQRNAAVMRNTLPEMQEIQLKITEARQMGNAVDFAQANQELMQFMKQKGCNPLKNMLVPMAQVPIFFSYFVGLRRMVNAPVESLQTGGMLWFPDLTMVDPYYLLPLITCSTLALTIHLGTDTGKVPTGSGDTQNIMMMVLKCLPVIIFPFIMNFPAALGVYWASSNMCSLVQGSFFRIQRVRTFFNIPQLMEIPKTDAEKKKQSFVQSVKGTWSNMKMSREIEDRRRLDHINFERAGQGPLTRTYKFDPTKTKSAVKQ